ncbi:Spy/CpxP family protein refolding chaperone [Gemmatimonadota bacterium]
MKKSVSILVLAGLVALGPSLASAQGGPPGAGQRQRMELEQRLQARFGQTVRAQLALTPEQQLALQEVMQSFQVERQTLNRAQASLRYRLRDPALQDLADEAARGLLQEMIQLQERELALYRSEQEQLLQVLPPAKLIRFYRLREDLGQRVQEVRRGGGGGGPGGMSGPAGVIGRGGSGGSPGGAGSGPGGGLGIRPSFR